MNMSYDTKEEAIAEFSSNDFIEFEDMNCNDWIGEGETECRGWDMLSHRCDCGNRRVDWQFSHNADGTIEYAFGYAY